MRILRHIFSIAIIVTPMSQCMPQEQARWNYGLSTHNSVEHYNMTYNTLYDDRPNIESNRSVKSAIAGGLGIWAERRIQRFLAVSSKLDYHSVRIDEELFSRWYIKVGGGREYQEWHRSISLSLFGRVYLPLKSKFKVNFDAGLKGDKIINFRSRYSYFDFRNWNHPYFSNLATGWVAGVGVQYGRLGLSLDYHGFPWSDAFTKRMAENLQKDLLSQEVRRSGVTMNANFRLNRDVKAKL